MYRVILMECTGDGDENGMFWGWGKNVQQMRMECAWDGNGMYRR